MFKRLLLTGLLLLAGACMAAVDVNTGTEAELDGIKGIGPSMTRKLMQEREKGAFKSWPDLMQRVKGIRPKNAAKLSAAGLTVQGQPFAPAAAQDAARPAAPVAP